MLSDITRKRIKQRGKMKDHSNPAQFLSRVKNQSHIAIKDLTLITENLDEKHLEDVFTAEKLLPLVRSLLKSKNKRTIEITEMLANCVFQKLASELPHTMVNELGSDIGKTWTYAKMALEFWDKPIIGKNT